MKKINFLFIFFILICSCNIKKDNSETLKDSLSNELQLVKDSLKNIQSNVDKNNDEFENIGRWKDVRPASDQTLTLKKNLTTNKFYLICSFGDGSTSSEEVRMSKDKGLTKFRVKDTDSVEWYIIQKDGNLGMYSQNGKFGTALCF